MTLILPDELVEDTRDYAGELQMLAVLADEVAHWTRELKEVDEALELVWAPETVEHPALVAGRYHIIEHRGGTTPPNVLPLTLGFHQGTDPYGDDGFMEPGSWMFDALRRANHWNAAAMKDRTKREQRAQEAAERARIREREERADELDERIKNIMNPSVSMSRGKRQWTNRAQARRAR